MLPIQEKLKLAMMLVIGLVCQVSAWSQAETQHIVPAGATQNVVLEADGKAHRFRIDLTKVVPNDTRVVRGVTYFKVTQDPNHYYSQDITWVPNNLVIDPTWGDHFALPLGADDFGPRYVVNMKSPEVILKSLGYILSAKGSRVGPPKPGGAAGAAGPEETPEQWGASLVGQSIESFTPSTVIENPVGTKKLFAGNGNTTVVGVASAGERVVNTTTGATAPYRFTYEITIQGPGMAAPEVIRPYVKAGGVPDPLHDQAAPILHNTLATWNRFNPDGTPKPYTAGEYTVILTVVPETGGMGGSDTAKISIGDPTVTFSGDKVFVHNDAYTIRACAGGIVKSDNTADDVHSEDVEVTAKWAGTALKNEDLEFSFDAGGTNYGAPSITAPVFLEGTTRSSTLTKKTDANGKTTIVVLSSNLISQPTLIVRWKGIEIGRAACDFAAAESKKLFAEKVWNETYATDTGWEFELTSGWNTGGNPPVNDPGPRIVFTQSGQVMTCRVYLRFRKDPDATIIDQNYYALTAGNVPVPSLDTGGAPGGGPDGTISEGEWAAANPRSTSASPLVNSKPPVNPTDPASKPLWVSVDRHLIRLRINAVGVPGDAQHAPAAANWNAFIVAFSDQTGNRVADDAARQGSWVTLAAGTASPREITVQTVNGVGTFYLRSGNLIHHATQIDLDGDDLTQR